MSKKKLTIIIVACGIAIVLAVVIPQLVQSPPTDSGRLGAAEVYDASTGSSGQVSFVDSSIGETVMVHIRDSRGNVLPGINVQYWDYTDAEMFIAEDPSGKYATSLEIYPHNSEHLITMHISSDTPIVREVSTSSEQGRAIENIVKHAQNEWVYIGKRTPEQLDKEEKLISAIVSIPLRGLMHVFDKAGKIAEGSKEISGWEEPEYYHVYRLVSSEGAGKITTAVWTCIAEDTETSEPVDEHRTATIPEGCDKRVQDRAVFHGLGEVTVERFTKGYVAWYGPTDEVFGTRACVWAEYVQPGYYYTFVVDDVAYQFTVIESGCTIEITPMNK